MPLLSPLLFSSNNGLDKLVGAKQISMVEMQTAIFKFENPHDAIR
jgi:hypothetical protein